MAKQRLVEWWEEMVAKGATPLGKEVGDPLLQASRLEQSSTLTTEGLVLFFVPWSVAYPNRPAPTDPEVEGVQIDCVLAERKIVLRRHEWYVKEKE